MLEKADEGSTLLNVAKRAIKQILESLVGGLALRRHRSLDVPPRLGHTLPPASASRGLASGPASLRACLGVGFGVGEREEAQGDVDGGFPCIVIVGAKGTREGLFKVAQRGARPPRRQQHRPQRGPGLGARRIEKDRHAEARSRSRELAESREGAS